jgi:hypothetical protein
MVHEFGWGWDDWDRLAAGTIAGHILECGAQCTGGNFSRWWEVPDLWDVGYPIVESEPDGSFVVTKHDGTGGMVTVDTDLRAAPLRDGRALEVRHPGRGGRLHHDPPRAGGGRTACGSPASRAGRAPTRSRSRRRTWPATRRRGRSPSPARARSTRRSSRPRSSGSGSSAPASTSARTSGWRSWSACRPVCRGSCRRRTTRPRWCCGWASRARTSGEGRALRQGDRAAHHRRPARGHRLRRRPAEAAAGGGLLAGAARPGRGRGPHPGDRGGGVR